jgi:Cu(I)/Ag(I) efflux system membrane protein CusA/SilA
MKTLGLGLGTGALRALAGSNTTWYCLTRPPTLATSIIAGLLPIMFGGGTGSEVMRRIAAPMVGGMIAAPILSMLVLPAAYLLLHR